MLRTLLLRFALPLILLIGAVAFLALPYVENLLTGWFSADVEMRAHLVMNSIEEPLSELVSQRQPGRFDRYLRKITSDKRLLGVLICDLNGDTIFRTDATPAQALCSAGGTSQTSAVLRTPAGAVHVFRSAPIRSANGEEFRTMIVHDLSFADRRQTTVRDYLLAFAALSALLLIMLVMGAGWLMVRRLFINLIGDIRGKRFQDDGVSHKSTLPVLSQVRQVLREIEREQRTEIEFQENWTPHALQHVIKHQLGEPQVIVLANREPYIHNLHEDGTTDVQVPASGMVTALEPITRACGGTWIAHGSGSGDRKVVDRNDRVRVPPADPAYTLRRVWLSAEEEEGFYYGFSNEGLWPLCHLAYVRPAFRENDWRTYSDVNRKFAKTVKSEATGDSPLVLIQDYHFALAPQLVREYLPHATIAVFWHIPWPNAETFGVCPWKVELLKGLLSADILGFHTLYHCQNFLATVDRFVECQIDREQLTVQLGKHVCHVAPYPISIEWPPHWLENVPSVAECRNHIRKRFNIGANVHIGVGIERWDFTKGILERFLAIEALLEKYPHYRERICFLQVAAPTRSKLPAYQQLQQDTHASADRINARFAKGSWKPIILIDAHQEPPQVFGLMRAADFCLVNSLHDGMNLVAKEFVAARDDEDGVLILSTFAGASRELVEALLVNPYAIGETAEAMHLAIAMPRKERQERMQLMRSTVAENNVYRWAGRMLMDASRIRHHQRLFRRVQN
ncbi:MAG: trehalose-6-phosphate synthase [Usitatibacteraceae bacterium]